MAWIAAGLFTFTPHIRSIQITEADIGRAICKNSSSSHPWKFHLVRERVNSQGYLPNGAYVGVDAPLWRYEASVNPNNPAGVDLPEGGFRARDRDDAKDQIRKAYPNALFFR